MNGNSSVPERPERRRYVPLLYRVAGVNVLLLVVAVGATIVVLDPSRVSSFRIDAEGAALIVALLLVVAINVYLVRRVVAPVQALTALARRVDLADPGERMPVPDQASEAGELASTFNEMLDRLEAERREATGRVLAGQEAERLRIAQELHDQVGQELTAVLLGLARVEARVPDRAQRGRRGGPGGGPRQPRGRAADRDRAAARGARRPRAGERARGAVRAVRGALGLQVGQQLEPELPALSPDAELVVYRVAQEALTNVARHSGADEAELTLATARRRAHAHGQRPRPRAPRAGIRPGPAFAACASAPTLIGANLTIDSDPARTAAGLARGPRSTCAGRPRDDAAEDAGAARRRSRAGPARAAAGARRRAGPRGRGRGRRRRRGRPARARARGRSRDPRHLDAADDRAAGGARASPPPPGAAHPDAVDAPERAATSTRRSRPAHPGTC